MDTALQAKEAPRLLPKKASLSRAAGVACWISLPSAWKMALQRWQTKSRAQTKHASSAAQRGSSEQREKTTVKSNLNRAQTLEPGESLVWRPPEYSLLKRFPWLPEEATPRHKMASAPWETWWWGSSSITPSWLLLPEAATQPDRGPGQASSSTWTELRPGGKPQPVLRREHCSPKRERFVPGIHPQCSACGGQACPSREQAAECRARLGGLFLYTALALRSPPHLKKWPPRHGAMAPAHSQQPLPSLHRAWLPKLSPDTYKGVEFNVSHVHIQQKSTCFLKGKMSQQFSPH